MAKRGMTCREWMKNQGTSMSVVLMGEIIGYSRSWVMKLYNDDFEAFLVHFKEALDKLETIDYENMVEDFDSKLDGIKFKGRRLQVRNNK